MNAAYNAKSIPIPTDTKICVKLYPIESSGGIIIPDAGFDNVATVVYVGPGVDYDKYKFCYEAGSLVYLPRKGSVGDLFCVDGVFYLIIDCSFIPCFFGDNNDE